MIESIKQNPALLSMRKQYETLPPRDRLALMVLSYSLLLILLIFGMLQPAYEFKERAELRLAENQKLLALVNENAQMLKSAGATGGNGNQQKQLNSQQLVSSVTNLAKKQKLALKRFEPSGDNKIKVWVDNASFDKVVSWLARLRGSLGIKVEQISIDKDDDPGKVGARMTLSS